MKIRTDFVTNSSSANFILEIMLEKKDGDGAFMDFAVSPEAAITMDGDMVGEDISLNLGSIKREIMALCKDPDKSIYDLVDLLTHHAVVIDYSGRIPENVDTSIPDDPAQDKEEDDPWASLYDELGGDDEDEDDDSYEDNYDDVTVDKIFPRSIRTLKRACRDLNLKPSEIKFIRSNSQKYGSGDSAMWINLSEFDSYISEYRAAESEEAREAVLDKVVEWLMGEPVMEVEDNEYQVDGKQRIIIPWDEEHARKIMKSVLDGSYKGRNYWMGAWANIETLDVETGEIKYEEGLVIDGN